MPRDQDPFGGGIVATSKRDAIRGAAKARVHVMAFGRMSSSSPLLGYLVYLVGAGGVAGSAILGPSEASHGLGEASFEFNEPTEVVAVLLRPREGLGASYHSEVDETAFLGSTLEIRVEVQRWACVTGRLRGLHGDIRTAEVLAHPASIEPRHEHAGGSPAAVVARPTPEGAFELRLGPGDWVVSASSKHWVQIAPDPRELLDGVTYLALNGDETRDVGELVVAPAQCLDVRVAGALGDPLVDAELVMHLSQLDDSLRSGGGVSPSPSGKTIELSELDWWSHVRTSSDGIGHLWGPAGAYKLSLGLPAWEGVEALTVRLPEGPRDLRFEVPSRSVSGVLLAPGGEPLVGVRVGLTALHPYRVRRFATSDESGHFTIRSVPKSMDWAVVAEQGYHLEQPVYIRANDDADFIECIVEIAENLSIRLCDNDGFPISGAQIEVTGRGAGRSWDYGADVPLGEKPLRKFTDANGECTFLSVRTGRHVVEVTIEEACTKGASSSAFEVISGARTNMLSVTSRFGSTPTVWHNGRVAGAKGGDLSSVAVLAVTPCGTWEGGVQEDGSFLFPAPMEETFFAVGGRGFVTTTSGPQTCVGQDCYHHFWLDEGTMCVEILIASTEGVPQTNASVSLFDPRAADRPVMARFWSPSASLSSRGEAMNGRVLTWGIPAGPLGVSVEVDGATREDFMLTVAARSNLETFRVRLSK